MYSKDCELLKMNLLEKLSLFLENSVLTDEKIIVFKQEVSPLNINSLLIFSDTKEKMYFKNKESSHEYLGLGCTQKFNQLHDISKLVVLVENNSDLLFMGAQRFTQKGKRSTKWRSFSDCLYKLPRILIEKTPQGFQVKVFIRREELRYQKRKSNIIFEIEHLLNFNFSKQKGLPLQFKQESGINFHSWKKMINEALTKVDNNDLSKIVLSRKKTLQSDSHLEAENIFETTQGSAENSYKIYFSPNEEETFISYSPETLFKAHNQTIEIDSVAGTSSRSHIEAEDQLLGAQLQKDIKELQEHRHVGNYVVNALKLFSTKIQCLQTEKLLKLKHVQHLHSKFSSTLNKKENFATIINQLHPTPAVGGHPKKDSIELIEQLEDYDRGLYAAPIGVISQDYSEFAVGIRSCLIEGNRLHLFAGSGIVKNSTPENEWAETENKFKNFDFQLEMNEK